MPLVKGETSLILMKIKRGLVEVCISFPKMYEWWCMIMFQYKYILQKSDYKIQRLNQVLLMSPSYFTHAGKM